MAALLAVRVRCSPRTKDLCEVTEGLGHPSGGGTRQVGRPLRSCLWGTPEGQDTGLSIRMDAGGIR